MGTTKTEASEDAEIVGVDFVQGRVRVGDTYLDRVAVAAGYTIEKRGAWVRITSRSGHRAEVHAAQCILQLAPA